MRLIKQETVDINGEIVVQYIYTLGAAGERKSVTELDRISDFAICLRGIWILLEVGLFRRIVMRVAFPTRHLCTNIFMLRKY